MAAGCSQKMGRVLKQTVLERRLDLDFREVAVAGKGPTQKAWWLLVLDLAWGVGRARSGRLIAGLEAKDAVVGSRSVGCGSNITGA